MKKLFKNYWEGKISLVKSYWVGALIIPIGLSIPFLIATSGENMSDAGAIFAIVYWVFLFFANMFLMIGAFKSASNYVKINKKKKKGTIWGILAQILLVLGMLSVFGQYVTVLAR